MTRGKAIAHDAYPSQPLQPSHRNWSRGGPPPKAATGQTRIRGMKSEWVVCGQQPSPRQPASNARVVRPPPQRLIDMGYGKPLPVGEQPRPPVYGSAMGGGSRNNAWSAPNVPVQRTAALKEDEYVDEEGYDDWLFKSMDDPPMGFDWPSDDSTDTDAMFLPKGRW